MNWLNKKSLGLLALIATANFAMADPVADATQLVADATTVFALVVTISLAMVGFGIVMKVVKGIRK